MTAEPWTITGSAAIGKFWRTTVRTTPQAGGRLVANFWGDSRAEAEGRAREALMTNEMAALLQAYLLLHPAFRAMPVGAPHSPARQEQDARIVCEDHTKAVLAKRGQP